MSHRIDIEGRLQALAATRLAPGADPALLARALAARAGGARVELPVGTSTRGGIMTWILAGGLAAGLATAVYVARPAEPAGRPGGPPPPVAASVLPGGLALPFSSRPLYRPVGGPVGTELKAGRWTYETRRGEVVGEPAGLHLAVAFERSSYQGAPAWLFLSGGWGPGDRLAWRDSVWATPDSARTIARWHSMPNGHLQEIYRDNEVLVGETVNGYTAWRTRVLGRGIQPPAGGEIQWHYLLATLQTAKLELGWSGSFGLLSNIAYQGRSWSYLNVRVVGEETQRVPAGEFDCWKLVMGVEDVGGIQLWVSKREGWLVAQEFRMPGKDLMRIELESAQWLE